MKTGQPIKILAEGRFIRFVERDGWEFIDQPKLRGIVVIVAVTPEKRLLLVEQYRAALDARVIELPAGMVGDVCGAEDEPFENAAMRELEEETGYAAERMELLTVGPASPGRIAFLYTFLRAHGLRRIHAGGGDEHEDIVVHEVPLAGLHAWLLARTTAGQLVDPKIWTGLYFIHREMS